MQPYIRRFNYIQDYYRTVHELYAKHYVASYPVTYYSVDFDNSVIDKEQLLGGSYEHHGVGELSGQVWRKILMLPVFGVEQTQPTYNASEKGDIAGEAIRTSVAFPSLYGIKPNPEDVIHFSQEFMMDSIDINPLMIVHNVEMDTWGDIIFYRCNLKVAEFARDELEKQISERFMFLEFTKRIHKESMARLLLRLESQSDLVHCRVNELFHKNTGFYLMSMTLPCEEPTPPPVNDCGDCSGKLPVKEKTEPPNPYPCGGPVSRTLSGDDGCC